MSYIKPVEWETYQQIRRSLRGISIMQNKKVLIAVNNMIFTSKIMSVLDGMDAEGIKAIRSDEIFTKAKELRPDLIIIDLNLNGIEAPSLINKLRSYCYVTSIPFVY